ncbi:hypothetical protein [Pedobacter sp.]|uniref:hypothetical protein n=1 Tax=Pedobacter sp. TaxID=1411316 RepID=UPI003D7FBF52
MNSLSIKSQEVFKSQDYVLVYDAEANVKNIKIDRVQFDQLNLDPGGIVVTAIFTPQASIMTR